MYDNDGQKDFFFSIGQHQNIVVYWLNVNENRENV
jgi:hypothetical protein